MLTVLHLFILMAVVWFCAYRRMHLWNWLALIAIVMLVMTYFRLMSPTWLIICWVLYAVVGLLFGVTPIRQQFLTKPVLGFFRRVLPPMSATEKEALDAGDVWWDGDLFSGRPDWEKFLALKKPVLSDEERSFLENETEVLCRMLDDWTIVQRDSDLPLEAWNYIKQMGFMGMIIPKEFGGLGFSALAHSCVVTKVASRSVSAAVNVMVPNSLGPGELLVHYGTDEQKNHYLPRLAKGEEIPCFALTGIDAGSDAAAMTDTGVICKGMHNGEEVVGIRLNFDKRYITLAPVATVLGLAFKLFDPDHLIGSKESLGITLCLIPATHPGVDIGRRHFPLNMAFMNGPIRGKDVFIPLDWIIGGPSMVGQGWRMLMECLSMGRGISLPALSAANAQMTYRMTGMYARLRKQFKLPVGKFQGVEEAMARLAGYSYTLNATRILTASAVDLGVKPSVVSAIAKYHMTEILRQSINDAMDIHAGRGIQLGPRNYLGHGYETTPVAITVEGANILTRNLIIFGQGAVRCHPYIRKEMEAAADPNLAQGFKNFDRLLFSHIGYAVSNFFRAFWQGLSGARWVSSPVNGVTAKYYQQLTRMSTALALVADIAMLMLGGELKRKERLSARLGDVLSQLYLSSAVLKYYQDMHAQPDDVPYVEWSIQTCLAKTQIAFDEFFSNFPFPFVAKLLSFVIFPWGRSYHQPNDKLGSKLAAHMMESSSLRDRLTNLCYLGEEGGVTDPVWRMENAFRLILNAEPLQQKLHIAIKSGQLPRDVSEQELRQLAKDANLLTAEDFAAIDAAEAARYDAMKVDDFAFDAFVRKNLN